MTNRQLFFRHLAQTSEEPIGLEMQRAAGIYIYDTDGKQYIDLISGFGVNHIGHSHPSVLEAINRQAAAYSHLIVYGEFVQEPQVRYASWLAAHLPEQLDSVYFTNSGAEAAEGAMKLAKRATGRSRMVAFNNAYHGSTQGALSVMGGEYWRNAFRPLLPGILHADYNSAEALDLIDRETACVMLETVQAESGVLTPDRAWLHAIRERCSETGALLVLDEVQAGFGRTGTLWAFEGYGIEPDILLLGKALGGGMPLGAFIASRELMSGLAADPVLGHITTFGGHPVSCAAGLAAQEVLTESAWLSNVPRLESILQHFSHPRVLRVRTAGCWASLQLASAGEARAAARACIREGLITDWFLFAPDCLRVAPPLSISPDQLAGACERLACALDSL